jgi:hypothetical protein
MGTRGVTTFAIIGMALVTATGCGSVASGSSTSTTTDTAAAAAGQPVVNPDALVKAILPTEVPGTHAAGYEKETLKDQLAHEDWEPADYKKAVSDLVHRSWVASGHHIFLIDGHDVRIVAGVNLFKTWRRRSRSATRSSPLSAP